MRKAFTPIKIGKLEVKNRFMMAPMENGLANLGGKVSNQLIQFFVERVENEVGIVMTGSIGISEEGRGLPTQLSIYDDTYIPGLTKLTEAVHKAGGKIGAQIYHAGRQATEDVTGIQPIAPSAIPCSLLNNNPREMTVEDMEVVKKKFVDAARRCIEANFDLIEVHFAHGYLLHSFLSPHSNKRQDEFGGSLENRMKYPIQVLKGIITEVGERVPVTIRISANEFLDDGLQLDEVKVICQEAVKNGAQAISLTAGSYDSVEYTIQPMFIEQGFLIPMSEEIKKIVDVPVIVAGRLNSANLIEATLEDNIADMVAIGRGLIADEQMVRKIKENRQKEIRYCVACNQGCIDNVLIGKKVACLVNARAGFEQLRQIEKAEKKKKVVVIGAGPAGLEAARVAQIRGHKVVVVDKFSRIGSKLKLLATPPEQDTFLFYRDYLYNQFIKLGIQFVRKDVQTANDIQMFLPDIVIVATGAHQTLPKIKGIEMDHVVLAEKVLQKDDTGNKVAIIGGGLVGIETAKYLASKGKQVHIIEATDSIAKGIGVTYKEHVMKTLATYHVNIHTEAIVDCINKEGVLLKDEELIVADTVVVATGYEPNNQIVEELKDAYDKVYTIGDAKEVRNILHATEEGFLVGSTI
ncbi:MAG: FAD-dependent oxidoreductase [Bacillaceae bacterium]